MNKKTLGAIACIFISASVVFAGTEDDPNSAEENRRQMSDIILNMNLPASDQRIIVDTVIDEGADASSDGLIDSGVSEESWEQLRDDARLD